MKPREDVNERTNYLLILLTMKKYYCKDCRAEHATGDAITVSLSKEYTCSNC
jgi:RNase P subunit RPR2